MYKLKAGTLVWYWDGTGQRTGVVTIWGKKNVTLLPTPCGKISLVRVPHTDVNEVIAWGGGRKRMSFKGWLRKVRAEGARAGYTKEAQQALRKLEALS